MLLQMSQSASQKQQEERRWTPGEAPGLSATDCRRSLEGKTNQSPACHSFLHSLALFLLHFFLSCTHLSLPLFLFLRSREEGNTGKEGGREGKNKGNKQVDLPCPLLDCSISQINLFSLLFFFFLAFLALDPRLIHQMNNSSVRDRERERGRESQVRQVRQNHGCSNSSGGGG